ncbi:MAG: ABC transporter permease [Thermotogae bacterium]|nr:ABC transporter permease [Thermotogota bacterium]
MDEAKNKNTQNQNQDVFENEFLSMPQLVWRTLKKHKLGMIAMIILLVFYFFAIFADFFSPMNPFNNHIQYRFMSSTKIYTKDLITGERTAPHVYLYLSQRDDITSQGSFTAATHFDKVNGYDYNLDKNTTYVLGEINEDLNAEVTNITYTYKKIKKAKTASGEYIKIDQTFESGKSLLPVDFFVKEQYKNGEPVKNSEGLIERNFSKFLEGEEILYEEDTRDYAIAEYKNNWKYSSKIGDKDIVSVDTFYQFESTYVEIMNTIMNIAFENPITESQIMDALVKIKPEYAKTEITKKDDKNYKIVLGEYFSNTVEEYEFYDKLNSVLKDNKVGDKTVINLKLDNPASQASVKAAIPYDSVLESKDSLNYKVTVNENLKDDDVAKIVSDLSDKGLGLQKDTYVDITFNKDFTSLDFSAVLSRLNSEFRSGTIVENPDEKRKFEFYFSDRVLSESEKESFKENFESTLDTYLNLKVNSYDFLEVIDYSGDKIDQLKLSLNRRVVEEDLNKIIKDTKNKVYSISNKDGYYFISLEKKIDNKDEYIEKLYAAIDSYNEKVTDLNAKDFSFEEKNDYSYNVSVNTSYQSEFFENEMMSEDINAVSFKDYKIKFFAKTWDYKLLGFIPTSRHFFSVEKTQLPELGDYLSNDGIIYIWGADTYGRDMFSRILYGSRISLSIGLIGILITFTIGLFLGGAAGYYGGWTDEVLMRLTEILMSIPSFYLLISLSSILPQSLDPGIRYILIIIILSFIGWPGMTRVIRGMTLGMKQSEFIEAAVAMGYPGRKIIWRHLIPNTTTYIIVSATLSIPSYIIGEAGLSFLGLGITEPSASWGLMLSQAQSIVALKSYPWLLLPGLFIFLTALSFNLFGDALRDALDPRSMGH